MAARLNTEPQNLNGPGHVLLEELQHLGHLRANQYLGCRVWGLGLVLDWGLGGFESLEHMCVQTLDRTLCKPDLERFSVIT